MIHAVLDTNVLASGFVGGGGPPDLIPRRWTAGAFGLIISEPILIELDRTLRKPYFRQRLGDDQITTAVDQLRAAALVIASPTLPNPVASHPADDLVLSTAATAEADYLVTGDAQLRSLETYRRVKIIAPRDFIRLLEAESIAEPIDDVGPE